MKRLKSVISVIVCILTFAGSAVAANPTSAEKNAQRVLIEYLRKKQFNPGIDNADNSVNFYRKDILHYITFKESANGMWYTLHRQRIKMKNDKDSKEDVAKKIEDAVYAANAMNQTYPFKTFVSGNNVQFTFTIFAESPEEYVKIFPVLLKNMENVGPDFKRNFERAKLTTDSIHNYWAKNDPDALVIPQDKVKVTQNPGNLTVSDVQFRITDANGMVISDYNKSIRKSDLKFIQPQIDVKATKKGIYYIGMRIITPDGKILLPSPKVFFTSITTAEVDKKSKPVELNPFGSADGSFWQAGEYKVIFYEGNKEIKKTSFTVL